MNHLSHEIVTPSRLYPMAAHVLQSHYSKHKYGMVLHNGGASQLKSLSSSGFVCKVTNFENKSWTSRGPGLEPR